MLALSRNRAEEPAREERECQGPDSGWARWSGRVLPIARFACGAVLLALIIVVVARSWGDVRKSVFRIGAPDLILAEALVLAGLGTSVATWRRAVHEVGWKVRFDAASKIYLLGQLGKYLPGSVWALAAQMELARRAGIPRSRGLTASVIAIGVNVVMALGIGLAVVPGVANEASVQMGLLIALVAGCAVALSPPVLTWLVNMSLQIVRRPPMESKVTWRGVGVAATWSITSWLSYGTGVWVLAVAAGAPAGAALPLCLAGVPLAMTVGFLVVVTPSGIGVREAILVVALSPVLDRPDTLAVALVARLLFTVADLAAALIVLPVHIRPYTPA